MDAATRQRIVETYPSFAWLLDIPEVGNLLGQAAVEGWDSTRLQAKLYATTWWRQTSQVRRNWETLVHTDPAEAQRQRVQRSNEVAVESIRLLGRRLSYAEERHVMEVSLREGWTASQITQNIVRFGARRPIGNAGQIRATTQEIGQMAKDYAFPVSSGTQLAWARRIAAGELTIDGIRAEMTERAKAKYAKNVGLIRGLERGLTVRDVMQPVLGRISEELGISSDTVDLTVGWGQELVNFKDSETGELRLMNDTEATQWARSQRQWRDTSNARSLASQLVDGITQRWGVRA